MDIRFSPSKKIPARWRVSVAGVCQASGSSTSIGAAAISGIAGATGQTGA
ncbi:Unknown protein sequence [Pseudomonas savastanoi pv. phaseolicola]|nr:Unknown protein sequence [Pseudomonas savastanoi pv. phaseolicola]KPB64938.1 Unknown protein sequence [Pseudomonas savastanoi pv. phaseolicola]KPB65939.1 Unknown protein sequence [Pseudomonas amygdali pv. mellea]